MKIRNGFVSNSSSSSFCIFGCSVDKNDFLKIFKKDILENIENKQDSDEDYRDEDWFDEQENIYEILEDIEKKWEKEHLKTHIPGEDDYIYLGFSFENIPEDAVWGEWEKSRTDILKKILDNENLTCSILEGCWTDY